MLSLRLLPPKFQQLSQRPLLSHYHLKRQERMRVSRTERRVYKPREQHSSKSVAKLVKKNLILTIRQRAVLP